MPLRLSGFRRAIVAALGTLTAALALASSATAATASGELVYCTEGDECRYFPDPYLRVTFQAAADEANDLRVLGDASGVRFKDAGAVIQVGEHCEGVNEHEALCGPPAPEGLVAVTRTGNGADRLFFETGSAELGPGDDFGRGAGLLEGGRGSDELRAVGGSALFSGGPGRDILIGGRRADQLSGGSGRDEIGGGRGNDEIDAADGSRDTIACGPGRDRAAVDRRDRVSGCEHISFG